MKEKKEKNLILHNIRSTHNVGSMFRTADSIGIDEIIISGFTPAPIDRFGRQRKDIAKTSLGAEHSVSWKQVDNIFDEIEKLKKEGFEIVALEQSEKSIDYKKYNPEKHTVIILGSEVEGVDQKLLDVSDVILEIPMRGEKESLNVSVATGVLLYRLFDN